MAAPRFFIAPPKKYYVRYRFFNIFPIIFESDKQS